MSRDGGTRLCQFPGAAATDALNMSDFSLVMVQTSTILTSTMVMVMIKMLLLKMTDPKSCGACMWCGVCECVSVCVSKCVYVCVCVCVCGAF